MTKYALIVSLRLRLPIIALRTHRYASQTSRRPDVSGLRLVCSTDIAISDGTFGGFVLSRAQDAFEVESAIPLPRPGVRGGRERLT